MKISKIVPDRGNPALPPRRNNRDWFGSELQANLLYGLKWAPDSAKLPGTQTFWKSKFPYSYMDWSNNPFLKRIPNALKLQVLAREPWRLISEAKARETRRLQQESMLAHLQYMQRLMEEMTALRPHWTGAGQSARHTGWEMLGAEYLRAKNTIGGTGFAVGIIDDHDLVAGSKNIGVRRLSEWVPEEPAKKPKFQWLSNLLPGSDL